MSGSDLNRQNGPGNISLYQRKKSTKENTHSSPRRQGHKSPRGDRASDATMVRRDGRACHPQTRTLQEFLESHHIQLPQIPEDQKDMLDDEFTIAEVQDAP